MSGSIVFSRKLNQIRFKYETIVITKRKFNPWHYTCDLYGMQWRPVIRVAFRFELIFFIVFPPSVFIACCSTVRRFSESFLFVSPCEKPHDYQRPRVCSCSGHNCFISWVNKLAMSRDKQVFQIFDTLFPDRSTQFRFDWTKNKRLGVSKIYSFWLSYSVFEIALQF